MEIGSYPLTENLTSTIFFILAAISFITYLLVILFKGIICKKKLSLHKYTFIKDYDHPSSIVYYSIIYAIVIAIFLSVGCIAGYNATEEKIKSSIKDYYNLNVLGDISITKNIGNNAPAKEPIFVSADNTDKIYTVYLLRDKESGIISLYTKNEKGAFMPVTKFSTATIK